MIGHYQYIDTISRIGAFKRYIIDSHLELDYKINPKLNEIHQNINYDILLIDQNYYRVDKINRPGRYGAVIEIWDDDKPIVKKYETIACVKGVKKEVMLACLKDGVNENPYENDEIIKNCKEIEIAIKNGDSEKLSRIKVAAEILCYYLFDDQRNNNNYKLSNNKWWINYHPLSFKSKFIKSPNRKCTKSISVSKCDVRIDEICQEWANEVNGLAICLYKKNKLVLSNSYGNEYFTTKSPVKISCMSNVLYSLCILVLMDYGLKLGDLVCKYIKCFNKNKEARKLKIEDLLKGQGYFNFAFRSDYYSALEYCDLEETMSYCCNFKGAWKNKTWVGINNYTFPLIARLIEYISGDNFQDFLSKNILQPLGMKNTLIKDYYYLNSTIKSNVESSAEDLLKLSVLMLNQGHLGKVVLAKRDKFQIIMPSKSKPGIGLVMLDRPKLPSNDYTYGFMSGSGTAIIVDPKNMMAMTITINKLSEDMKVNNYLHRYKLYSHINKVLNEK